MGIVRKYNKIKLVRYGNTKNTPFLMKCCETYPKHRVALLLTMLLKSELWL